MDTLAPYITHVEHRLPRQLPLNAKAPLMQAGLVIVPVESVGIDPAGGTECAERILGCNRISVGDHAARGIVRERRASGERRIEVQNGVVVELMDVVIDAVAGADDGFLA